jgi:RimJ/RimL family protein N-acetyltransferase
VAIRTQRMMLEPASAAFVRALDAGERTAAERALDVRIEGDWFDGPEDWLQLRARQLDADPALSAWLLHVMVLSEESARTMVGHCGYHGRPDPTGMVEVGYQVGPPYRRRGYAIEAVRGLIDNAFAHPGVSRVRASISPDNTASLGLVAKLGFVRVGEQIDEVDGLEYVFESAR